MSQRSREAYLWDIADSCRAILKFSESRTLFDYQNNRMFRRAGERELSTTGEAVGQATKHFPELEESIGSARQIAGFRNRITHSYAEVNSSVVWGIVQNEVPGLLTTAESLLDKEK